MIVHILRSATGWIFCAALVYAPFAYGGTTPASIQTTNWLVLAAVFLWIIELIVSRRMPRCPGILLFLTCSLIGIGGWMVINSKSIYDSDLHVLVPLRNLAPHLPGSIDHAISAAWMIRAGALLGATLFIADLSRSDRWYLRLWYVIGLVAGSIAFLGLLQKATGAQMIFWRSAPPWGVNTFFATFYYHANAGAFLNLVWPLTAGLAIRAFTQRCHPAMRAVWISMFVLTVAAVLANTSRLAQLIALLLLIAICFQFWPVLLDRLSHARTTAAVAGTIVVLLTLFALARTTHLEQVLMRWQSKERIATDARWQATRVAVGMLPDVGCCGFGPGTFRVAFPYYNLVSANRVRGTWRFLHEDYVQTVLEWGWLGSGLWALLFFGGIAAGIYNYKRHAATEWSRRRRLLQPLIIIAFVGVALHALVDFPLQIASIQLYVATYLGLSWGSGTWFSGQK